MSSLVPYYSANFLSKEEEKREFDSLTDAETEAILNDKYGQRQQQRQQQQQQQENDTNNNNNNNNNGEMMMGQEEEEDNIVIDYVVNDESHGEDGNEEEMIEEAVENDEDFMDRAGGDGEDGGQENNNNNGNNDGNVNVENNNNNNNNDGNDDDISEQLLQEFHDAIDNLPSETTEIFWRAVIESHEIVEEETYPAMFLRAENYNPERAALRLCEYWNIRYELFGDDDGFGPMVIMNLIDAIIPMIDMSNFIRILPNDDHGRTVICIDRTGISFKDYDYMIFAKIVFSEALKKQSTQRNGIVMITINKTYSFDFVPLKFIKLAKRIHETMPIKVCYQHNVVSSFMDTMIMPIIKYILPRNVRLRMSSYNCLNVPRMLRELESCGLHRTNLPRSIGGSYDEEQPWITECKNHQQLYRIALRRHEERRQRSFEETRQMSQTILQREEQSVFVFFR